MLLPTVQPVAHPQNRLLCLCQTGLKGLIKLLYILFENHGIQRLFIVHLYHIHQTDGLPVLVYSNGLKKGHFLGILPACPQKHQYLIFHASGCIGGQS